MRHRYAYLFLKSYFATPCMKILQSVPFYLGNIGGLEILVKLAYSQVNRNNNYLCLLLIDFINPSDRNKYYTIIKVQINKNGGSVGMALGYY